MFFSNIVPERDELAEMNAINKRRKIEHQWCHRAYFSFYSLSVFRVRSGPKGYTRERMWSSPDSTPIARQMRNAKDGERRDERELIHIFVFVLLKNCTIKMFI